MAEIFQSNESNEESWMSVSDLMAGLMIVFLFIAIVLITSFDNKRDKLRKDICNELEAKLEGSSFDICKNNKISIEYKDENTLFDSGDFKIKPQFKETLKENLPLLFDVTYEHREDIAELRIEGHTSPEWEGAKSGLKGYFNNTELSQKRALEVMDFLYSDDIYKTLKSRFSKEKKDEEWLEKFFTNNITAHGLSSSINKDAPNENLRRVEFKIILNIVKNREKQGTL